MTALRKGLFSVMYGKHSLSVLFSALLMVVQLHAQVLMPVGTGSGTNGSADYPCPLQDWSAGSRAQYLYRASEMTAAGIGAGNISSVSFIVTGRDDDPGNAHTAIEQYSIKIGTTVANELNLNSWVTGTKVVYGPVDYNPTMGINTFTFITPFYWNGSDNLVIEVCNGAADNASTWYSSNNPGVLMSTALGFNASHTYTAYGEGSLCNAPAVMQSGETTSRPNVLLGWTLAPPCSGTPVGGTAISTAANVCMEESFILSPQGSTIASGMAYQWQYSRDNTVWKDIPRATTAGFSAMQDTSTWYRVQVTCKADGTAAYSTAVQVTSPLFAKGTFIIDKNAPAAPNTVASFNDACNLIKCGISGSVQFIVAPGSGPYNEQLIMQPVPGASATRTVTFSGNGETLQYNSYNNAERAVIKLNGADHIIFDSLVIQAGGDYGYGVHIRNNADSNTISRCIIQVDSTSGSQNYAGIVINNSDTELMPEIGALCDGNNITGNTISGGYSGLVLSSSSTVANGRNTFRGNRISSFYKYGMYVLGSFMTTVENNIFSRGMRNGDADIYGILATDLNTRLIINANTITRLLGGVTTRNAQVNGIVLNQIKAFAGVDNVVSNNLLYSLADRGGVKGIVNAGSTSAFFYNNTLSLDGHDAAANFGADIMGYYQGPGSDNVEFRNNIVTISRTGPGTKTALYYVDAAPGTASDNNNLFIFPGTDGSAFTGHAGTSYYPNLSDWKLGAGSDPASVSINPFYIQPEAGNLRPANIALDNTGVPVTEVPADRDGTVRSTTTPDLGAYEFTPPLCVTPPVAGHIKMSKDTVCPNSLVMMQLTGNSAGNSQLFQWQVATSATGPFTSIGAALPGADTAIRTAEQAWYRVMVMCGGVSSYSDTVRLTVRKPLAGGTYVIDKNGTGNFSSFNDAKAAMGCGVEGAVIFNITPGSGPYEEQLVLEPIPGASATNTITFNGFGNTLHFSSDNSEERAVIKLNDADHFIFDSLTINADGAGSNGYGVQLINNADSNIFRRCRIEIPFRGYDDHFGGIVINASAESISGYGAALCDGNLFDRNSISGGYYGVSMVGNDNSHVFNNKVSNSDIRDFYARGVHLAYTENTVVEYNTLSRPTRYDVSDFEGVVSESGNSNLFVNGNRFLNPFGGNTNIPAAATGVVISYGSVDAGKEMVVANNLVYNFAGKGDMYGMKNLGSNNVKFLHNTIALDDAAGGAVATTTGFYLSFASAVEWRNNIVTVTRNAKGDKRAIQLDGTASDWVIDNNDYYVASPASGNSLGMYNGSSYTTLAEWQTALGQEAHTLNIDPVYSRPAIGNFQPAIAAMDNTGSAAGITSDILGVARKAATPDIGAYEFTIQPCTAPPVAGTTVLTPASGVCMGAKVDFSLNGNSTGGGQTYQWQNSAGGTTGWRNAGPTLYVPEYTTEVMHSDYFRCAVTCGTDTVYSVPVQMQLNAGLPAGVYTIDNNGTGNFPSFAAAVAAMECGIEGAVTFEVKPGVYHEKIRMHRIYGASDTSRVTFRAANGLAASVLLTNDAADGTDNYTLMLDSASYITWRELTIQSTNTDYGHVVQLAHNANADSIVNCSILAPATTATGEEMAAVYVNGFTGTGAVIKGNMVQNGSMGICLTGNYDAKLPAVIIDSNQVSGAYRAGIYASYASRLVVTRDSVSLGAVQNIPAYGIYLENCDSSLLVNHNKVSISNTTVSVYGITLSICDADTWHPVQVEANAIVASGDNTGDVYGLQLQDCRNTLVRNNVISIHSSGTNACGVYNAGSPVRYENNSIHSTATGTGENYAVNVQHFSIFIGAATFINNIISATGGGKAVNSAFKELYGGDYNLLYTAGNSVGTVGGTSYSTLQEWVTATDQDFNSLVYKPAFVSDADLHPAIQDSAVWAMHGRGIQITGNDHDFNNQPRPVTLKAGVPDLGAYEFMPTSLPPVATAVPAVPVPGRKQTFLLGTDTIYTIQWGATVPQQVKVRRYSGVMPPALPAGAAYMYFYTDAEVTGTGAAGYTVEQHYLDPWKGYIDPETRMHLARTKATGEWLTDAPDRTDIVFNVMKQQQLDYLGRFTGLADSTEAIPKDNSWMAGDSSNSGTRFWVAYGNHSYFKNSNAQDMVLYLSAREAAHVTVRINGTPWVKQYDIPAHTVISSDLIPKSGVADARLMDEGKYDRGISIESDVPIVVYAHIYGNTNSGATMLLPVGTYGYDYYSVNSQQVFDDVDSYSWFYVVASHDSTAVEITPSNPTLGGRAAGLPFTVLLNKGEVYQVMGAIQSQVWNYMYGYDLTGSHVRSVKNAAGRCYPVAVFSGSSRTAITCEMRGSGDNIMQQNFPSQAWGRKYLTAPTAVSSDPTQNNPNVFRVVVKNAATVVKRNGIVLTGLINNTYYEYTSDVADYIEADQPVIVAQYMISEGMCGSTGVGDPEMFYLSPVEQGIKEVYFYRNTRENIKVNYLTLIIPDGGLKTLTVDGSNVFTHTYAHPNRAGYTVVVKRWDAAEAQVTVQSDSAFTAITYGQGSAESYGYNAGTLVRNLNSLPGFTNVYDTSGHSSYTCVGTPFRLHMAIPVKPTSITWKFSEVPGLTPHADSVQVNPVPTDSTWVNGRMLYHYSVNHDFVFSSTGVYYIPAEYQHPDLESCDNTSRATLEVTVIGKPAVDFTVSYSGCLNDKAHFTGTAVTANGVAVNRWKWNFDDNTGSAAKDTVKQFTAPGTYLVKFTAISTDGCIADTTKPVKADAFAALNFDKDSVVVCEGTAAVLTIAHPEAGIVYEWYDAPTGGSKIQEGNSYTIGSVTRQVQVYVTAVKNGCASPREKATAAVLAKLVQPVIATDSVSPGFIRFRWQAVPGATGYEVSPDNITWGLPSSGSTGLTHVMAPVRPGQTVDLWVKAKGSLACQDTVNSITAYIPQDKVFVPNSFTPNGDGLNDVIKVYGAAIRELRFAIFNQWGEKVFETHDLNAGWDGMYNGKPQPSGVYIYACQLVLTDGTAQTKKGTVNLIR